MPDPIIMGNNVAGQITFTRSKIEKRLKLDLLKKAAVELRNRFNELDDQMLHGYAAYDSEANYEVNIDEIVQATSAFVNAVNSYKAVYDAMPDVDGTIDVLAV